LNQENSALLLACKTSLQARLPFLIAIKN